MSEANGKVCCNCRHNIRIRDKGYTACYCEVQERYLPHYAEVMEGWCRHWAKEKEQAESEPQEISDRNLKMWEEIYAEEKRREGSKE